MTPNTTLLYSIIKLLPMPATAKGFEQSSSVARGGSKLAPPCLLWLKPEDVVLTGSRPFRDARFTWVTESMPQERWIVASCGAYSVVWNMLRWGTSIRGSQLMLSASQCQLNDGHSSRGWAGINGSNRSTSS